MKVDPDPFTDLEDAYGPAVDVPGYLETIATGTEATRMYRVQTLLGSAVRGEIVHEGSTLRSS